MAVGVAPTRSSKSTRTPSATVEHTEAHFLPALNPCWESCSLIKNPRSDKHSEALTVQKHHFSFHAPQSEHVDLISINPYLRNGQLLNCVFFPLLANFMKSIITAFSISSLSRVMRLVLYLCTAAERGRSVCLWVCWLHFFLRVGAEVSRRISRLQRWLIHQIIWSHVRIGKAAEIMTTV